MSKDFDCMEMKNRIQADIYEEIKDLSAEDAVKYWSGQGEEFERRAAGSGACFPEQQTIISAGPKKDFDCVEMKNRIQAEIYEEIKDLSHEELVTYFSRQRETLLKRMAELGIETPEPQPVG